MTNWAIIGRGKVMVPVLIGLSMMLTGCVGSSTYGTGKSQGAQLFDDINGIIPLGTSKTRNRIDYSSRPKLVKPSDASKLPEPVLASATSSNANFPEDPEVRKLRIRNEATKAGVRSGHVPVEELTRKKEGAVYAKRGAPPRFDAGIDTTNDNNSTLDLNRAKNHRRKVIQAKADVGGVRGAAPRRYLTEPPAEYRTPATTAVAGDVGLDEDEKEAGWKKKKGFNWSKLNPFD